jgi:hypothetical protein
MRHPPPLPGPVPLKKSKWRHYFHMNHSQGLTAVSHSNNHSQQQEHHWSTTNYNQKQQQNKLKRQHHHYIRLQKKSRRFLKSLLSVKSSERSFQLASIRRRGRCITRSRTIRTTFVGLFADWLACHKAKSQGNYSTEGITNLRKQGAIAGV